MGVNVCWMSLLCYNLYIVTTLAGIGSWTLFLGQKKWCVLDTIANFFCVSKWLSLTVIPSQNIM